MPLEDDLCDIIKKARTGLKLSVGDVARLTGLPGADITALERGDQLHDRAELRAIANVLGLRLTSLEQIVLEVAPQPLPMMPGIETVQGEISGYAVKGYIVHDGGEAVLVDTAYNAEMMIEILESRRLRLVGICLTHGHADHAEGIQKLVTRWPVPVYLGAEDLTLLHWKPSEKQLCSPRPWTVHCCRPVVNPLPRHARSYARRNLLSCRDAVGSGFVRGRYALCRLDRTIQSGSALSYSSRIGPPARVDSAAGLPAPPGAWSGHHGARRA